ncbi:outer membrane protein assembly factor BamB [Prosthecobacter fusiformis]|uniref:Outer membrane protein assembly factor BamB n=1 Tax=Prosthecobacter fusiformis TaxID=48464 RepID=A0A4R7SRJ2_9BACT|nr:PQQ-binding-like beta-propeller repeat protein [Prosthecobacter fusiformis]TDU81882.1 outer membrane protein assembly factor BamB [Prosthecobacter fusiformis]
MRTASFPFFICAFSLSSLFAADWPQFLGPQRNGIADASEPALKETFKAEPDQLWEKSVGAGFAGPVVTGGKVILFHREGSDMTTEAVEAKTGKVLWRSTYVTDYVDSFGFDNGPRSVPAVANGRVFTHGPEGRVTALDLKTGKEIWAYDTASAVNSQPGFFGRAPSPLVVGDKVIIVAGGSLDDKPAGMIALDTATGKLVWNSTGDEAGYASPVVVDDTVLSWMRNRLWSVNPETGFVLDSIPLRADMEASVNAATPVPCGEGRWFVTAGYGVGANLLKITPLKQPAFETVWQKQKVMDCHYSTPVYKDGHLYGFDGRQETGQKLRCIEVATGKVCWDSPGVPGGTLLLAGDKLLVVTEQGELWIVKAAPDKFDQLATMQILRSSHRSHAAFANGILYARDTEKVVAIRLSGE